MSTSVKYAYEVAFFSITAKSSLHVGAGGENFWIVDNLVQRDPATNLPCIYASSLKGALREYMRDYLKTNNESDWIKILFSIFGNDKDDIEKDLLETEMRKLAVELKKNPDDWRKLNIPGQFRFMQADLLSIPVHKEGVVINKATCKWLKDNFNGLLELFECKLKDTTKIDNVIKVDETLDDAVFCEKVDDFHLPVIARNHLEDGTSTNLWYEQVLPRETKLFFAVLYEDKALFDIFRDAVIANPVQIGANASVGYGFCKIELIDSQFKTLSHDN